jgi:hypothetical protein
MRLHAVARYTIVLLYAVVLFDIMNGVLWLPRMNEAVIADELGSCPASKSIPCESRKLDCDNVVLH